jgi:hypothetical protein
MSYLMKEDKSDKIKEKFKCNRLAEKVGITNSYLSLVMNRKKSCSKILAYCITKAVNSNAEISDYFDLV